MTQEQLNNCIAEELNKWQPILEYGRIFLDEDKNLRDKYKWLMPIKRYWPWGVVLTIVDGIVSHICNVKLLWVLFVLLMILMIIGIVIIYNHRGVFAKLVDKGDRKELEGLLDITNKYLSILGRWLVDLDSHKKQTTKRVNEIELAFVEAKTNQLHYENKSSKIYGNINPEWEMKAKEYADKRLQHYKQYLYE